jgi:hypothetical protein
MYRLFNSAKPVIRKSDIVETIVPFLQPVSAIAETPATVGVSASSLNKTSMIAKLCSTPLTEDGVLPKTIVYSSFSGTFETLGKALTEAGIKNAVMNSEVEVNALRRGDISVLCVHNLQFVAGLNIEFGDLLVFYHLIPEKNIETQLIGRCQRRGRRPDHVLKIRRLYYSQEYQAGQGPTAL